MPAVIATNILTIRFSSARPTIIRLFQSMRTANQQELATRTVVMGSVQRAFSAGTYYLSQNYPNPFNPTTTISFILPEAGQVRLVVYDILGKEVARLADGNLAAATYSFTFDASHLSSGEYYYRLESGNFSCVRKLTLIK